MNETQLMKCRDCGKVARCETLTGKVIEIVEDMNQLTRSATCIKCFDEKEQKRRSKVGNEDR